MRRRIMNTMYDNEGNRCQLINGHVHDAQDK